MKNCTLDWADKIEIWKEVEAASKRTSAQAPVEDLGESQLVGSGSLVRAIQALRAAEVCIMRTIETREEEPEIAARVFKIALENIETAKGHLCPNVPGQPRSP